jgi:hypothetical protein
MATYYWLGKQASTGTGNVNISLNWTQIAPWGTCGSIPPSSPTIPGNGDTIIFTKFVGASYNCPIYSPGGTLGTGVSGSTAFVSMMYLYPDCPVLLGICGQSGYADEPFRFNVINVADLSVTQNTPGVSGAHYIEFKDNKVGVTAAQYDPRVYIKSLSFPPKPFRVSGVVGNLFVGQIGSPLISSNSDIYLTNVKLSGNTPLDPTFYRAINAYGTSDRIFISETAQIYSGLFGGTCRTFVSPGFGTTGTIRVGGNNPTSRHTMEFVSSIPNGSSYGTALTTQIGNLEVSGGLVNVYHGLGISFLNQQTYGTLNFNVPPGLTGKMCSVYEGIFNASQGAILTSEYATLSLGEGPLGSGGSFVITNQAAPGQGTIPQITLKGRYDIEVNPESGSF